MPENNANLEEPLYIGKVKLPDRLILAPMCGITHLPFRKICKDLGAGLVFNQMVSAKALTMKDAKSLKMLEFTEAERPVGMQLFGNDPQILSEAAKIIQDTGPDIIDLNLGCPAKKIVNDGGGSALMGDLAKLEKIFSGMRKALTHTSYTVKMRAGWDDKNRNALDVARIAQDAGVDAVTIHARTRSQQYSGKADWDYIRHLKENLKITVIGNGDVWNRDDATSLMQQTGCDAVMTGRGAFQTPWIFQAGTKKMADDQDLYLLIARQYELFSSYFGEVAGIKMMRKHMSAYTHGMRNGSDFRNRIMRIAEMAELKKEIASFWGIAND